MSSSTIELPSDPSAPGMARQFVAECARRLGFQAHVDTAMLLITELVTNAWQHAEPPLRLICASLGRSVRLSVADGSPAAPRLAHQEPLSEGGRGLLLVDALAASWGSDQAPDDGKVVWFELALD